MRKVSFILLLAVTSAFGLVGQENTWFEKTKVGLHAFGDYYYLIESQDQEIEGRNGFWMRRIYLTLDHEIDERLSARLRFEANHPGDFTSSGSLEPFVKDAWLGYAVNDRHTLTAGISPTPAFAVIEDFWGYRPLEKTPNDLFRINASRDFGVAAQGSIDESGRLGYHVMFGNGSGVGNESNEGKYVGAALRYAPSGSLLFEVYADWDARPGNTDRSMLQGFAGLSGTGWRAGAQFLTQKRQHLEEDQDVRIVSLFGVVELSNAVTLIGRLDSALDPIPDAARIDYLPVAPGAELDFLLVGLDLKLHRNAGLIPNVEYLKYEGDGSDPADDAIARLTFYLKL